MLELSELRDSSELLLSRSAVDWLDLLSAEPPAAAQGRWYWEWEVLIDDVAGGRAAELRVRPRAGPESNSWLNTSGGGWKKREDDGGSG